MIRTKLWFVFALALAVTACTDSGQAEETARRQRMENELARIQNEKQDAERRIQQEQQEQPQEEAQPEEQEAPPEPQYEEKEYYMFTSLTEKTPIKCEESEESACGLKFTGCEKDNRYYCQTNVKYYIKTEKVLVQ